MTAGSARRWAALACLWPAIAACGGQLDPARVQWSAVDLAATRLFATASISLEIAARDPARIGPDLLTPPVGQPLQPGASLIELRCVTRIPGLRTAISLLIDPPSGAALQLSLHDDGRRLRERHWRFTDSGAYHWTRWPADTPEQRQPAAAWTQRSEGMRAYPAPPAEAVVTDTAALLYVLAAAALQAPGDRYEVIGFSRRQLHRITAEVAALDRVAADYRENRKDGAGRRRLATKVVRITLRAAPWPSAVPGNHSFELFGLSRGIEVALDVETRAPVELSGSAPYLGRIVFRLKSVTVA